MPPHRLLVGHIQRLEAAGCDIANAEMTSQLASRRRLAGTSDAIDLVLIRVPQSPMSSVPSNAGDALKPDRDLRNVDGFVCVIKLPVVCKENLSRWKVSHYKRRSAGVDAEQLYRWNRGICSEPFDHAFAAPTIVTPMT